MSGSEVTRLWRLAGWLLVAYVALELAGASVQSQTALTDAADTTAGTLAASPLTRGLAGGYVEYLATLVLLVALLLVARLLRGASDTSAWLASCVAGGGVGYVAVTIASGFSAGATSLYAAHQGAAPDVVALAEWLRVFSYVLSGGLAALVAAGIASGVRATGELPRWITYSGWVVALISVGAVAGAGLGAQNVATMLWLVWLVALAVAAMRRARRAPVSTTGRRVDAVV